MRQRLKQTARGCPKARHVFEHTQLQTAQESATTPYLMHRLVDVERLQDQISAMWDQGTCCGVDTRLWRQRVRPNAEQVQSWQRPVLTYLIGQGPLAEEYPSPWGAVQSLCHRLAWIWLQRQARPKVQLTCEHLLLISTLIAHGVIAYLSRLLT